jgi:hypothetical protein
MAAIARTTMIAASLAIVIYIAVIATGNYLTTQSTADETPLSQQSQTDNGLSQVDQNKECGRPKSICNIKNGCYYYYYC